MKKICIVGPPGCGKTTLATDITNKLKMMGFDADVVLEYVRSYIVQRGKVDSIFEEAFILDGQERRERELEESKLNFVICDSATFIPYIYAADYRPRTKKGAKYKKYIHTLNDLYLWVRERIPTYDYIFYVSPGFKPVKNGVRNHTLAQAKTVAKRIKSFLDLEKIKYYTISGSREERMEKVLKIIKKDLKK